MKYLISFNDIGEITEFRTERHMGEGSLEAWVGKASEYKEINGILIPTFIEASYKLQEGEHNDAKFNVEEIRYDRPKQF